MRKPWSRSSFDDRSKKKWRQIKKKKNEKGEAPKRKTLAEKRKRNERYSKSLRPLVNILIARWRYYWCSRWRFGGVWPVMVTGTEERKPRWIKVIIFMGPRGVKGTLVWPFRVRRRPAFWRLVWLVESSIGHWVGWGDPRKTPHDTHVLVLLFGRRQIKIFNSSNRPLARAFWR